MTNLDLYIYFVVLQNLLPVTIMLALISGSLTAIFTIHFVLENDIKGRKGLLIGFWTCLIITVLCIALRVAIPDTEELCSFYPNTRGFCDGSN